MTGCNFHVPFSILTAVLTPKRGPHTDSLNSSTLCGARTVDRTRSIQERDIMVVVGTARICEMRQFLHYCDVLTRKLVILQRTEQRYHFLRKYVLFVL
jgi:hypothetical protein